MQAHSTPSPNSIISQRDLHIYPFAMTSPQDAFLYDRLPSETSIRLIALEHLLCEDIHLSLQTFELEEAPTYDALSYTWGDPRCAYLHLDSPETSIGYTQDCYEVRCNGSKFMVRRNLKDALDMLQWWYSTSPAKQNFVWIDAICIDQTSILERESQVSLMDRIYRKASTVIAWIGQEDASTPDALTVIERISSVPIISGSVDSASASDLIEYAKMFTTQDMLSPSAHISKLGIEPLSLKHWLGLIGFLHRPYFKRVWVVQEVTLANKLLAICGRRSFEWTALSKTLLFIALTNWVTQLHTEYLRVYSQSDPGIYHRLLQLNLEPGYGAYYLTQTRRETRNFNRLFRFATLLKSHRHCDASDPRDKIFALIGISRTPPFTTTGNPLRADYSISFEALYTKVTRMLPCSEGNLDFLSWREVVNKQRHTSKLPSWVPDYRNALIPDSLNERSKTCNWNAHGHLCWKPGIQDWSDPLLPVQGFCVGSITSVTEQEPGVRPVSWREIYQVSRGLEPLYLARRFDQCVLSLKDLGHLYKLTLSKKYFF